MYQVTMTTPWGTYVLGEYDNKEQAEKASTKLNAQGRHTRVREKITN